MAPFHSVPSQISLQDNSSDSHPTVAKSPSLLYQAPIGTSTSAQPNTEITAVRILFIFCENVNAIFFSLEPSVFDC